MAKLSGKIYELGDVHFENAETGERIELPDTANLTFVPGENNSVPDAELFHFDLSELTFIMTFEYYSRWERSGRLLSRREGLDTVYKVVR